MRVRAHTRTHTNTHTHTYVTHGCCGDEKHLHFTHFCAWTHTRARVCVYIYKQIPPQLITVNTEYSPKTLSQLLRTAKRGHNSFPSGQVPYRTTKSSKSSLPPPLPNHGLEQRPHGDHHGILASFRFRLSQTLKVKSSLFPLKLGALRKEKTIAGSLATKARLCKYDIIVMNPS